MYFKFKRNKPIKMLRMLKPVGKLVPLTILNLLKLIILLQINSKLIINLFNVETMIRIVSI